MTVGKLVVIEGLDGSGKNTQTKLLLKYLDNIGVKNKYLTFPNYDCPSSSLIKMYLNSEFGSDPDAVNAYAASSFYAVDRFASFKKFWEKEYKQDYIILCDRYTTSNAIYQMCKLPESEWNKYLNWLSDYEYEKLQLPKPDKVIYLSVPIEISQSLLTKRYMGNEMQKDIHESNLSFLKDCKKAAEYVAKTQNWNKIECAENGVMRSVENIQKDIIDILQKEEVDMRGT
ncbi:MAG: deoxynucleoside kinase [Clostridia bacterium]|nr:deoxynucleoside kinase [Clostridia bacterium]